MKILHLADLHIGKKVNDFCMLKEQKYVLNQAINLIKKEKIEAVLIAGDIFDKPIPTIAALELFDNFLKELNKLKTKVLIISGNHDNMDRLSYLSNLLEQSNIFISKSYNGNIQKVELDNKTNVYLMPYLYPVLVKKYYPNDEIKTYSDAIKKVVDEIKLDKNKFNILLAHQFVIGNTTPTQSQSEQKSVGGIDEISYKIFDKFDYTALGHLHCPQRCGSEKVQYAGSILKYSLSEINQKKKFIVLNIEDKLKIEFFEIKFLHEMREYRGFIDEFLDEKFYKNINTQDYVHFVLQDEYVLDAKKKLSLIYPNIMLLEFDNSFTRNLNATYENKISKEKSLHEHFSDFYQMQFGENLDSEKEKLVINVINSNLGGETCVL